MSARRRSGICNQVRLGSGHTIGTALLPGMVDGRHHLVIARSFLDHPPPGIERYLLM